MCSLRHSWSLVVGFSLLVGSGCSDTTKTAPVISSQKQGHDHEEHDHSPESLKDALAELTSLRDTIRDSFAKNDQDAAHGPLHDVGAILEAIPELAKKEKVSAANQAAIETAVNTLMDAFGNWVQTTQPKGLRINGDRISMQEVMILRPHNTKVKGGPEFAP